jgi:hypothetical protein
MYNLNDNGFDAKQGVTIFNDGVKNVCLQEDERG